ncbi:MAG: DUF4252 domain-containing protein [Bacteroidales bacterium]|nr:DUF4252 domain-containing protein [Bacteroidales bacterium]
MKKYAIISILFCLTVNLSAQNKAIDQLFKKYSERDGYTSVVITKNMFQLFANVESQEDDDFLKTVKNLEFIKILSVKGEMEGKAFYNEVQPAIPEKDYKELMTIKESGNNIKFLTLEQDGVIRELIMISNGKEESTMIWITGKIDMKSVAKIAQGMNIDGMKNLEKADGK